MHPFRDLLSDVLGTVLPFKDAISHLLVRSDSQGNIAIAAKSRTGDVDIRVDPKIAVPEFHNVACLGALPYLNSVVNSKYIRDGGKYEMNMEFGESSRKEITTLKTIEFTAGRRMNAFYQATDPYLTDLNKVKGVSQKISEWDLNFLITQDTISDYMEGLKIHRSTPRSGSSEEVFRVLYADGDVYARFGDRGNTTKVLMSDSVENVTGIEKLNPLFGIDRVRAVYNLIGREEAVCSLTQLAIRFLIETELAEYTIVAAAKKLAS